MPRRRPRGPLVAPNYLRAHRREPDYTRPLLEVRPGERRRILAKLGVLYGAERAEALWPEVLRLMRVYHAHRTPEMLKEQRHFDVRERFSEKDVILITYGDLLLAQGRRPLAALASFLYRFMRGTFNTVHILPFFPYSSDRGFSILDYEEVDPRLGEWADIEAMGLQFRLMFDGVFNHASAKSRWFQRFLNGRPGYQNFFVAFTTRDAIDPDHLRLILRPRTSDLLTPFRSIDGPRWVWTTFSPDQVDLNFREPEVLLRVLEILLVYVRRGADIVRLDAVTYIWRELGTRCAHLEQGHAIVQLFRAVLDVVAPEVALITETNVPHADNVGYFGDGKNEAQMVYNFALPPLVLLAFHTGDASHLTRWASGLKRVSDTATHFNFLDSHDGIGLLGARDILSAGEIALLVERCRAHGGLVSQRSDGRGGESPYELNITWWSALNRDDAGEPQALQVARFIASRAIALSLVGVPGVYLPSLFGARNDSTAVLAGHEARSINRKTIDEAMLVGLLLDRRSWVHQVATRFRRLVRRRIARRAFHPNSAQRVLDKGAAAFCLLRAAADGAERVLCLASVVPREQSLRFSAEELGGRFPRWRDALTARLLPAQAGALHVTLPAYGVVWLEPEVGPCAS